MTGNTFCRQPQVASTLKNIERFVNAWKIEGDSATRRLQDFKLSHRSLVKYLPLFGMSFDEVRLDYMFRTAKERAMKAIEEVQEGKPLVSAWKDNNVSSTTYYKYAAIKEPKCT